jgi:hypothetical protein
MSEWNVPEDIDLVSKTFDGWAERVIAKDRPSVEAYHDDGFRVRIGQRIYNKAEHVTIELAVEVREMSIIEIEATRRLGDFLFVWSKHRIRADEVPEIPELGLLGDWGDEKASKAGFVQYEFTAWRRDGQRLRCLTFEARR